MRSLAAMLLWLACFAISSAAVVIRWLHANPSLAWESLLVVAMLGWATTGAVLVAARPRNPTGWLLLTVALLSAQSRVGQAIALHLPQLIFESMPVAVAVAAGSPLSQLIFGLITLILLTFPDGRFLSPRWRAVAIGTCGLFASVFLVGLLKSGPISPSVPGVAKPFGVEALVPVAAIQQAVLLPVAVGAFVAGIASLVRRYRSGGSVLRQQIKWMIASASLFALTFLTIFVVFAFERFLPEVVQEQAVREAIVTVPFLVALVSLPLAIGVAVLRYRLYDIDLLINRTLVYGALTALLGATYFGAVALLQNALRPLTGGSELAVAGSTLTVVALFAPLRRRIQDAVDHRFSRSRYDAARTLDAFSARLRDEVDLDAVRADLLGAVRDTVQPAHASVWLRERAR